jgi:hypothetical protein
VTLYAKWIEIVEPDDGGDSGVVDPTSVNWYVDYTSAGGNFNYHGNFSGFVFANSNTVAAMQGVPINAVKVLPSVAGTMNLYKVTGTDNSNVVSEVNPITTFVIPEEDVITPAPTDGSQAKTYRLATTITLANNERLLIKGNSVNDGGIYVSTANKPAGSNVLANVPVSGSTGTPNVESWCGSVGYGYISDTGTNPPVEPDEPVEPPVEPDNGDEGGSGGTVIDPASITWYADNSGQTGKNFNYHGSFPGAAVGLPAEDAELLRGVPINVVKFVPSAAGKMFFAKWVPDNAPVLAATVDIPEDDVGANTADAKIYPLSNTVTLADNEYLICGWNDISTLDDTGGFWVNAGSSERFKAYVLNTGNTIKAENWGIPFGFGYQE